MFVICEAAATTFVSGAQLHDLRRLLVHLKVNIRLKEPWDVSHTVLIVMR
jgi:hypothetical protein